MDCKIFTQGDNLRLKMFDNGAVYVINPVQIGELGNET